METTKTNIVGIDYSTTSPSICVRVRDNWDIHYLTTKQTVVDENWVSPFLFFGHKLPKIQDETVRYKYISSWAVDVIDSYDAEAVFLEDYAFAATGKVFHIGENTGILKYRLLMKDIPVFTIAPTVIKKFATGKGNAKKDMMLSNFITSTGCDVRQVLDYAGDNPISDIVDSYFICEYGIHNVEEYL